MFSSWVMRNWGQGLGQVHTTGWRTGFTTLQKVLFLRAWHRGKKGGPEGRWFFSVMISFVNLSRVSGLLFLANKFVQHIWLGTVFKFSFIKIKVKRRSYCFCVCPVHSYSSKRWWPLVMFAFQTPFLSFVFSFLWQPLGSPHSWISWNKSVRTGKWFLSQLPGGATFRIRKMSLRYSSEI